MCVRFVQLVLLEVSDLRWALSGLTLSLFAPLPRHGLFPFVNLFPVGRFKNLDSPDKAWPCGCGDTMQLTVRDDFRVWNGPGAT